MAVADALLTAEAYLNLPDNGCPTELVKGRVVTMNMPAPRHGQICANIIRVFGSFLDKHDVGQVVCNDSGVKHLAVARSTPTLTVFGPTNPVAWNPPGSARHGVARARVPCLECNFTTCLHQLCMRLLDPVSVADAALQLLSSQKAALGSSCAS